jgi:hypothetical protein
MKRANGGRVAELEDCQVLPVPKEAEGLTRALLSSRLIPAKAEADAAHIAIAAVHGMEFQSHLQSEPLTLVHLSFLALELDDSLEVGNG